MSSPGPQFGEINLVYDLSPEQSFLKLFIRSHFSNMFNKKMIHLDLICNEFEYEILYKKTFPEINIG